MNYPCKLPEIERNSFYSPYQYLDHDHSQKQRSEQERKKREFTTTYYEYVHDSDGNCRIIPHHYEDEV